MKFKVGDKVLPLSKTALEESEGRFGTVVGYDAIYVDSVRVSWSSANPGGLMYEESSIRLHPNSGRRGSRFTKGDQIRVSTVNGSLVGVALNTRDFTGHAYFEIRFGEKTIGFNLNDVTVDLLFDASYARNMETNDDGRDW